MRKHLTYGVIITAAMTGIALLARGKSEAAVSEGPMLVHSVYFSLKDGSPEAKKKMVEGCKKYLTKHDGEIYFAAGTLAEELKRPINDRDFDVGLVIIFKSMADYKKYETAERHQQLIQEVKDTVKTVRVFDSLVEQ